MRPGARVVRSAKDLVGRTITYATFNLINDGKGGETYIPSLTLDDGSVLVFDVIKTAGDDYGIHIVRIE